MDSGLVARSACLAMHPEAIKHQPSGIGELVGYHVFAKGDRIPAWAGT
jgi:hypothetical protein